MKIKIFFSIIIILFLTGCSAQVQDFLYHEKPAFYACIIGDVQKKEVDLEYDADVYATPASCQKIVTALLALKTLGPDFRYETKLYVTRKAGKLENIVLNFSGDPTLTSANILELLKPLKGRTINGKIILDASLFKTPAHSPNMMIGDVGTEYGQPVSSINLDKNLIIVTANPGKINQPAKFQNDTGYAIINSVKTTSEPSDVTLTWEGNKIKATGNINPNDQIIEFKISPVEADLFIQRKMAIFLKKLKITGRLEIVKNKTKLPNNLILLNSIKSDPLSEIIKPALKKSDNLVFDSLYLKILATQNMEEIEDWSKGSDTIKLLIKQYFNIDMKKAFFVDGSGLSRYNRIQPRQLFEILKQGYFVPEFVNALPQPGEIDSTLEKRNILSATIKAKTGSMSGISCLGGYSTKNQTTKAFVIMASSFAPPSQELYEVMDRFINSRVGE